MQYSQTYRLPANERELHPREEMEKKPYAAGVPVVVPYEFREYCNHVYKINVQLCVQSTYF